MYGELRLENHYEIRCALGHSTLPEGHSSDPQFPVQLFCIYLQFLPVFETEMTSESRNSGSFGPRAPLQSAVSQRAGGAVQSTGKEVYNDPMAASGGYN